LSIWKIFLPFRLNTLCYRHNKRRVL